jgi:hypothetical protein
MARRQTSERKRVPADDEGWASIKVSADLDDDVVVQAIARLLWATRKSRGDTVADNTNGGESGPR